MKAEPLVSVIIVNWNGGMVFRDCLKTLQEIKYPNWELILVDNGSIDGSKDFIKEYKLKAKKILLLENQSNLGYAKANNQAYISCQGKYILLLNNDTKLLPNLISELMQKIESSSAIGVIQPKIYIMDKKGYLDNAGAFLTSTGFLQHWGYMEKDGPKFSKQADIFSAKGACMLIRKSVIERVGLFDEEFGSYFEETDFCWRVWLLGFKIIFYPKAQIYHKVGFTSKKQDQIFVNYHSFKNRIRSMTKNLEFINLVKIGGLHIFLIIGLSFFYLLKLEFNKFLMIWRAILWNIIYLPSTLSRRVFVQDLRKRSDAQIFKSILKPTNWSKMFSHFAKVEANFK